MKKYELTKEYLTGIDMIDKEHGKLFDLANECYELVMDDEAVDRYDRIVELLDELRDYAATHLRMRRSTWSACSTSGASVSGISICVSFRK